MNIDGDPEMLASASIDQVIAYGPEASSECKMLEAVGVSTSGSGGLQWVPSSENAVVVNKYRMMCAMLKDATRNRGYAQAIELKVRAHLRKHGTQPLVLDIGTGSGFLGMVAARAGARVVACEMNDAVAAMARAVVAQNGLQARMEVRSIRSDALTRADLNAGAGADLIITETMDSELLSEGMVPTLRHACEQLLSRQQEPEQPACGPPARVVPRRARIFAELVEVSGGVDPCLRQLNRAAVL